MIDRLVIDKSTYNSYQKIAWENLKAHDTFEAKEWFSRQDRRRRGRYRVVYVIVLCFQNRRVCGGPS